MSKRKKVEIFDPIGLLGMNWDDDDDERISVYDAADNYFSSGQDEDERYGYTEEELRRAYNR